jgi:TIR domain
LIKQIQRQIIKGSKLISNSGIDISGNIFISYSTPDQKWLDQLLVHLRPLIREERIQVFSNKDIRVGTDWRRAIQEALARASVAVLLISADFLASDFIAKHELPPLLEAAERKRTIIIPVFVRPSLYQIIRPIADTQAANSPDKPLSAMRYSEQEEVWVRLASEINEIARKDN